ncbi:MAG: hypothetical protein K1X79_03760 [Oligoflexia bacterium]|nr:hypothetical protein [Oligoflexia bacterium]
MTKIAPNMPGRTSGRRPSDGGFYLAFLAILLLAIIALAVAVLGLGKISASQTGALNSANIAALAALEGFVNSSSPQNAYDARIGDGVARAVALLNANRLPGSQIALSQIDFFPNPPGPNGQVEFGMWYPNLQAAPPGTNPCGNISKPYPCFVPNSNPATVNAVHLSIHTDPAQGVPFDLGSFLGVNTFNVSAESYAAIVPRCSGYGIDISSSTQFGSHKPYIAAQPSPCLSPGWPPSSCNIAAYPGCCNNHNDVCLSNTTCSPKLLIDTPDNSGNPAAINPNEFGLMAIPPANLQACGAPLSPFWYSSAESYYWCNYPATRDNFNYSTAFGTPYTYSKHFQDDYVLETVGGNQVLVDKYYEPPFYQGAVPFSDFFLGFNVGLRKMQATQSGTDQSLVYPFNTTAVNPIPSSGLTNDLGFLIQLTNLDNAGRRRFVNLGGGIWGNQDDAAFPVTHPNYIDRGWYPTASTGNTNLVGALLNIANSLVSPNNQPNQCPALSSKSIILATDGVGTCYLTNSGGTNNCGSTYSFFQTSTNQLLSQDIEFGVIPSISQILRQRQISLTALVDGQGVRPNFYNIKNPAVNCGNWTPTLGYSLDGIHSVDSPDCYLTYEQARAQGFGGVNSPHPFVSYDSFDNNGAVVPAATAFDQFQNGAAGWIFGESMGVLTQLAVDSGGFICPLLPPLGNNAAQFDANYVDVYNDRGGTACSADMDPTATQCNKALYKCSPCVLKSKFRNPWDPSSGPPTPGLNAQLYAVELKWKSTQAADCVRVAVGLNPYTLVSP